MCCGMSVIYASLAYMGVTSPGSVGRGDNGGIIMSMVSEHYFGFIGKALAGYCKCCPFENSNWFNYSVLKCLARCFQTRHLITPMLLCYSFSFTLLISA